MFLSFLRIIKFSIQDIYRNIWLSLVTIIILILALFSINMLLVVRAVGQTAVNAIKQKIDINLYLKNDSQEQDILALKAKVENLPETKSVLYISKTEALKTFKEKHQDNPEILSALREIGKNPLAPSLVIKPKNLDSFDNLITRLNGFDDSIIESRNFTNYKLMLEKINSITDKVSQAGMFLSLIFIFITVLVIYNSVRVAIYTHRREITIMRLVGASRWFVQAPYLVSGVIYTLIGTMAIIIIFYPFLSLLQPYLETFFVGYDFNLINYFYQNVFIIFGSEFVLASLINVLASQLAVSKYSKV